MTEHQRADLYDYARPLILFTAGTLFSWLFFSGYGATLLAMYRAGL